MKKIAIVTDSTSDLPDEYLKKYDISVVPLYINAENKEYIDKINITNKEIYKKLKNDIPVKTSAPPPKEFIEVYDRLINKEKKKKIISIHISSKLSNTFESAKLAKGRFPDADIDVIDSRTVSSSLGLIVLEAARLNYENKDENSIIRTIEMLIRDNIFYATVDNFEYLLKGGRIQGLNKLLNIALKIRPIFSTDNGRVKVVKITRTRKSSIESLANMLISSYRDRKKVRAVIFYGEDMDSALCLKQLLDDSTEINISDLFFTEITPVIGSHSGPSVLGLSAVPVY